MDIQQIAKWLLIAFFFTYGSYTVFEIKQILKRSKLRTQERKRLQDCWDQKLQTQIFFQGEWHRSSSRFREKSWWQK